MICKGCSGGQCISLTTATEIKTLTAGNDTVTGTVADSINNDTIVDSLTTDSDVLNALVTTNATATISNVEAVNIDDKFGGSTITATNISGGKLTVSSSFGNTSTITGASGDKTLSVVAGTNLTTLNLNNIQNLNVDAGALTTLNLDGDATNATTTAASKAIVKLNGTAATIGLVGGGDKVASVTLNSTTAANTVTLNTGVIATTGSVALTGDKNITLKAAAADLDKVALAGGVTKSMTSPATATVNVTTNATADLTSVAADTLKFSATAGTGIFTVANNANLQIAADVGGAANFTVKAATGNTAGTVNLQFKPTAALTLSNKLIVDNSGTPKFTTVNLDVQDFGVTIAAAEYGGATVNVTGAKDLTLTGVTKASKIVATDAGFTGKLAYEFKTGGVATVTGGAGNDTFTLTDTGTLSLTGGAGTDTVKLAAVDYSTSAITLAGIEAIDVAGNAATVAGSLLDGKTYVLNNTGAAADLTVHVVAATGADLSGLTANTTSWAGGAGNKIVIDVDAGVVGLAQTIKGTNAADSITGGNAADTISAGSGNDSIIGGTGADVVDGGAGNDTISFLVVAAQAGDTITGGTGDDIFLMADGTGVGNGGAVKIQDFSNSGTNGTDTLKLDLSSLAALKIDDTNATVKFATTNGSTTALATGTVSVANVTADNAVLAANDEIVFLSGKTYADKAAALADVLTAGERTFTVANNIAKWEGVLVAYELTGGGIEIAAFQAAVGGGVTSNDLTTGIALVDLVGVTPAQFALGSYAIVA